MKVSVMIACMPSRCVIQAKEAGRPVITHHIASIRMGRTHLDFPRRQYLVVQQWMTKTLAQGEGLSALWPIFQPAFYGRNILCFKMALIPNTRLKIACANAMSRITSRPISYPGRPSMRTRISCLQRALSCRFQAPCPAQAVHSRPT